MLLCAQYLLPITSDPIVGGAVLVRDGRIRDIGKAEMLRLRYPDEEVSDYGNAVLMPGLIDVFTRLENSVMRGLANDVPYVEWVKNVYDLAAKMDVADWYDAAILGGLDSLSSGITCVADITATGAACTAAQHLGLRGVIYREVGAMDKRRVDHAMYAAENDIMHWRAEVDPNRITIGIAPARIYMCHPAVFGKVTELARREKLPVAMRLAGSLEEYNFVRYGSSAFSVHGETMKRGFMEIPPWLPTGTTPVRYALNWGAFESDQVLAVHCVHVDDEDIKKMREYNVNVAVCPRATAQLGMGVAPVHEFLRAGLNVGLGTDSPAATNSTDLLTEMRLCLMFQRAVKRGTFLTSAAALEMATIGAARALGIDQKVGSLEIGKCADIIAIDISSSHQSSAGDAESAVVSTCNANDVVMTMVDGKVLYEKNHWHVDVEVAKHIGRVVEIRGKLRS